ncbi:MAG: hypothetical protein PUD80_01020, partial [Firmicutes bacterium]|nr:hypothetical protein [Bacillota bacterium]
FDYHCITQMGDNQRTAEKIKFKFPRSRSFLRIWSKTIHRVPSADMRFAIMNKPKATNFLQLIAFGLVII